MDKKEVRLIIGSDGKTKVERYGLEEIGVVTDMAPLNLIAALAFEDCLTNQTPEFFAVIKSFVEKNFAGEGGKCN